MRADRAQGGQLREEGGFTLTELLAAVSIGIVIVLAAFTLLDSASSASRNVDNRVDATQRARQAMGQITQRLRARVCLEANDPTNDFADDSTTSLLYGDGNMVLFYADLGDESFRPQLILFRYLDGTIHELVYEPNGTAPNLTYDLDSPTRSRVLVTKVSPPPGDQVFRYYAYQPAGEPTPHLALGSGGSTLSQTDLKRTVRIDVGFVVSPIKGKSGTTRDATYQTTVTARGARFPNSSQSPPDLGGPECLHT